ncbi:hypothetical protein O3G_MSEX009178, partial [Manduca sexta]
AAAGDGYGGLYDAPARHAYMNRTLDLDPVPLQEVCIGGAASGGGGLSASRLRLLHDTTMIDAALDLDEPEPPPHLGATPG